MSAKLAKQEQKRAARLGLTTGGSSGTGGPSADGSAPMRGGAIMMRAARGLGRTVSGRKLPGQRGKLQKWDSRTSVMSHASLAMGPLPVGSRRSVFEKTGAAGGTQSHVGAARGTPQPIGSPRGARTAPPLRQNIGGGSKLNAVEKGPAAIMLAAMSPPQRDRARAHKIAVGIAHRCAMVLLSGLPHDQVARIVSMGD